MRALRTVCPTGTYAWGDPASSLVGGILLGYVGLLSQESPTKPWVGGESVKWNV